MTTEAEDLTSDFEKSERLRSLVVEIRRKAKVVEHDRLKRNRRSTETRYQLCMIGIPGECNFSRVTWANAAGLETRLHRIPEDIDRTS